VEQIQTALKAAGYKLPADGIFGAVTDNAVRDYQKKNGLAVDGVVGPKTWAKLGAAGGSSSTTTTAA
jgi:peptidoglycan hydrolase-like protein with peptidoglycan-binding domain